MMTSRASQEFSLKEFPSKVDEVVGVEAIRYSGHAGVALQVVLGLCDVGC